MLHDYRWIMYCLKPSTSILKHLRLYLLFIINLDSIFDNIYMIPKDCVIFFFIILFITAIVFALKSTVKTYYFVIN